MKLRASFVHVHRAAVKHRSVQGRNGALGFSRLRHLYECDAAGLARIPVVDDGDGFDCSVGCKQFPQLLLRHRNIQVSDKDVSHGFTLALIFGKSRVGTEHEISKGDLDADRLSQRRALKEAGRSQPASPWGPS